MLAERQNIDSTGESNATLRVLRRSHRLSAEMMIQLVSEVVYTVESDG